MGLTNCPECGGNAFESTNQCPNCGNRLEKPSPDNSSDSKRGLDSDSLKIIQIIGGILFGIGYVGQQNIPDGAVRTAIIWLGAAGFVLGIGAVVAGYFNDHS